MKMENYFLKIKALKNKVFFNNMQHKLTLLSV